MSETACKRYRPHFMIVPSLSCPAACSYCFGPNDGPMMDVPAALRTLDFMESIVEETGQNRVRITLHGGEPLAAGHAVVEALVAGAYHRFASLGCSIAIQSNLWLLDDRYCELFTKYGVSVSTSLDGPDDINRLQRGEGYSDRTLRGIELARSHGLHPGCIATFTSLSAPDWRRVFDDFLSRGQQFCMHPCVASIGRKTGFELMPEQYAALFHELLDRYLEKRKDIRIETIDQICQGVALGHGKVCTFQDCFGMFLSVDPTGDIYGCQRFAGRQDYRLGNIAERPTMKDLASSDGAQRLLRRESLIAEKCSECQHFSYCKGGCPYNSLAAGAPDSPDPYCEAYKTMFSLVRDRLHQEMVSDENQKAISELGPAEKGHPLLRTGPLISLVREHLHPYHTANTARKIVAAYELAAGPDLPAAALRLATAGVYPAEDAAFTALTSLWNSIQPGEMLNKLYLHVTWNCQLQCSHCYASAVSNANTSVMNASAIAALVRDGAKCGFREIVLTGGEPLLRSDRAELLRMLQTLRWEIKPAMLVLRTNFAMPLSCCEHNLLAMAFDEIVVSVDGNREGHDLRRGTGAYDKTVANLEEYVSAIRYRPGAKETRAAKLSLSATMQADQVNGSQGRAVKDLGNRLGMVRVKFRPLLPLGRALRSGERIEQEALYSHLSPLERIESGFRPVASCGIGQNLYVEPDGEAYPCYSYHPEQSFLGSVFVDGLEKIVTGERFCSLRSHTVDTNPGCSCCSYRYLCGGACRAWAREVAQLGLDDPPSECENLKRRAQELYKAAVEYLRKR